MPHMAGHTGGYIRGFTGAGVPLGRATMYYLLKNASVYHLHISWLKPTLKCESSLQEYTYKLILNYKKTLLS